MSSTVSNDSPTLQFYERLPALYRLRDAELGYPLRGLLAVVAEQASLVKEDIDGLREDLFVETCADWAVPYIGELIGNRPLHPAVGRRRADVAKTIHYRRRKGTVAMLTELAHDVTGWSAFVVPFFEHLGWTQHLEHFRPESGWPDLRGLLHADRVRGPFGRFSHTVDVRRIGQGEGWHNIRNVGVFLWRLQSFPMRDATPSRAAPPNAHGYHFSPLGNPAPLFSDPGVAQKVTDADDEAKVAAPIRRVALFQDLRDYGERYGGLPLADQPPNSLYYGPERSIQILRDGVAIAPATIFCMKLGAWQRPPAGFVGLDVHRGRISFPVGEEPAASVSVSYRHGFSAELGGGPYDRRRARMAAGADFELDTVADPEALGARLVVGGTGGLGSPTAAVAAWRATGAHPTVIEIVANEIYAGPTAIPLDGPELVLQARNRVRPTLIGDVVITIPSVPSPERLSLVIDGLAIAGQIRVQAAGATSRLLELTLRHCTLVPGLTLTEEGLPASAPGTPSLIAAASNDRIRVTLDRCISGPLRIPAEGNRLTVRDSIVDALRDESFALAADDLGNVPGAAVELERVTVLGATHVRELTLASETIFTGRVLCERRQSGCARFSYIAPDSITPRRYRCQPELAVEKAVEARLAVAPATPDSEREAIRRDVRARLAPAFTARRYGAAAYAQLALRCPVEIRTGAQDGSEMGAFEMLKQPQRESNLDLRLEEYLPFGLEAARIYVT